MSNGYRYGIAAAVVALAAILGFSLLNRQVGPQPTPTPIPTPSFPSLYRSEPSKLAAGAYRHRAFYLPLTLTVPEGWTGLEARSGLVLLVKTRDGEPFGTVPNVALLSVTAINGVFADPCLDAEPMSPAPATVDEVVDAFTHQVGIQAGPVSTVSFGTHDAKVFDLDNSIDPATCHESVNAPLTQWTFLESPGSHLGQQRCDRCPQQDVGPRCGWHAGLDLCRVRPGQHVAGRHRRGLRDGGRHSVRIAASTS